MLNYDFKNNSLINNYIYQLKVSLSELGHEVTESEIEKISIFLVRAQGSELRNYHRPEHSLDVSKEQPPIARISSLFHDVVYVQVDPQWRNFLGGVLSPMLPAENFTLNVKEALPQTKDQWFKICTMVFGFEMEEKLIPMTGLNEFLSALVLVNQMQNILSPKNLIKAISCIEATIPFRKKDALGNTPSKRLTERLNRISKEFKLELTDSDINLATLDCRSIVENDLSGFRSEKLAYFLSDSWNVLSENHQPLRNTFFLISDYRKAVFGLIGFFQMLDPDNMFWNDVTPINPLSARYANRARYNLKNGAEYLKGFFLSLSIIEAVANETGGDAPYEYFVGAKKSSREHAPPEIGDMLPMGPPTALESPEQADIYAVLLRGREVRAKFDRKYCPLGAYLFYELSLINEFENLFQSAVLFHKGELPAKEFLKKFPEKNLAEVLTAISKLATSRAEQILALN